MPSLDVVLGKARALGRGEKIRFESPFEMWQVLCVCLWTAWEVAGKWTVEALEDINTPLEEIETLNKKNLIYIREQVLELLDRVPFPVNNMLKPMLDGVEFCIEAKIVLDTEPNPDERRCKIARLVQDYKHIEKGLIITFMFLEEMERQVNKSKVSQVVENFENIVLQ